MGKAKRMQYHANPGKAGDFFYKDGDGKPGSDIAVKANLFEDGDPLVDRECHVPFCVAPSMRLIAYCMFHRAQPQGHVHVHLSDGCCCGAHVCRHDWRS